MVEASVNGKKTYTIDHGTIDGVEYQWDLLTLDDHSFHILRDNQSYRATVINVNHEEKTMLIRVNGNEYEISIKDKYDLLLKQMGISSTAATQVNNFKAPMPGLIREIMVSAGAEVSKGDTLLILEAMKMENALKSPRAGKIKKINIATGNAVEKGQVMLEFE
jgi:acetyl/propionyl-CoA carboxylase alpha subunit